jgi:hypothetical protein
MDKNNSGVKGFLLLLCILLTLILPAFRGYALIRSVQEEIGYPSFQIFSEKMLVITDSVLVASLLVFSIFTGISLWTRRRNALKIAKAFMLSCIGYSLLIMLYPLVGGFSNYTNIMLAIFLIKDFTIMLLFFGSCYLYLLKSRRVKSTYPE